MGNECPDISEDLVNNFFLINNSFLNTYIRLKINVVVRHEFTASHSVCVLSAGLLVDRVGSISLAEA